MTHTRGLHHSHRGRPFLGSPSLFPCPYPSTYPIPLFEPSLVETGDALSLRPHLPSQRSRGASHVTMEKIHHHGQWQIYKNEIGVKTPLKYITWRGKTPKAQITLSSTKYTKRLQQQVVKKVYNFKTEEVRLPNYNLQEYSITTSPACATKSSNSSKSSILTLSVTLQHAHHPW